MSTKTSTIKRIALVAVAALGLGMLSGVAANAVSPNKANFQLSVQSPLSASGAGTLSLNDKASSSGAFTDTITISSTGLTGGSIAVAAGNGAASVTGWTPALSGTFTLVSNSGGNANVTLSITGATTGGTVTATVTGGSGNSGPTSVTIGFAGGSATDSGAWSSTTSTSTAGTTTTSYLNLSGTITGVAGSTASDVITLTPVGVAGVNAGTAISSSNAAISGTTTTSVSVLITAPTGATSTTVSPWSISIPVTVETASAGTYSVTATGALSPGTSVITGTASQIWTITTVTGPTFGTNLLYPSVPNTGVVNALGYTVSTTASAGYVTLSPTTSQYSAVGLSNVTLSVAGGALLSATPASQVVTCTDTTTATATFGVTGTSVAGGVLSASGGALVLKASQISLDHTTNPQLIAKGCTTNATPVAGTASDAAIKIAVTTAGTITVTATANSINPVTGVANAPVVLEVITIIVNASLSSSTDYSYSTATLYGSGYPTGWKAKSGIVYAPATAGNLAGSITVEQFDAASNAVTGANSKAVTYTLTGVGSLNPGAYTLGTSTTFIAVPALSGATNSVNIYSDGRPGTASVAVAVNGVVVKTRTVKFYGAPAKVEATPIYTIGQAKGGTTGTLESATTAAGYAAACAAAKAACSVVSDVAAGDPAKYVGASNDVAVAISITDALGTPIPTAVGSVTVTSSNVSVLQPVHSTDAFIDNGGSDFTAGDAVIHDTFTTSPLAVSGDSATLTYSVLNPVTGALVSSTPVKFTVGGAVVKEVLALDATSYEPGAPMVLTITATDASGNPVYDGATGPALTASKTLGGALPSKGTYVGGKISNSANKLFAPATYGDFLILGTGTDVAATKLSITGTVTTDTSAVDAANEATDAANAATDAANAAAEAADAATAAAQDAQAAVAALATQVAALIAAIKAQITSLTNLVIKIQKKLKA